MRGHSLPPLSQDHNDFVHDEVTEVLKDICDFIAPLVGQWKWVLFIDPGTREFKYWSGNMDDLEFENLVERRLGRIMEKMSPSERREHCDHMIAMWTKWKEK